MGSPEDLAAALNIVEREGPSLDLHLNRSKSLLCIPKEEDESLSPLPSDILPPGMVLLSSDIL